VMQSLLSKDEFDCEVSRLNRLRRKGVLKGECVCQGGG
jgi:hypothetical protein